MIGIVVPAHNEEAHLGACIRSLRTAARHRALKGESVRILVVLDDCTDGSEKEARAAAAEVLPVRYRRVGAARAAGAEWLIARGARWLAFTDADSEAGPGWLADQLALRADLVCGTVEVADWSLFPAHVKGSYEAAYTDRDGHRHVHGANLGISARAYSKVGGFPPIAAHEDLALVRACLADGQRVAWSARPRVRTSARLRARAPEGFAAYLRGLMQVSAGSAFDEAPTARLEGL